MGEGIGSEPRTTDHRFLRLSRPVRAGLWAVGVLGVGAVIAALVLAGGGLPGRSGGSSAEPTSTASEESTAPPPPGTRDESAETTRPVLPSRVSEDALLAELQATFGDKVTGLRMQQSGSGDLRIDVQTSYRASADVASIALDLASAAAQADSVIAAYPDAMVSAYVWPGEGTAYMTRATARFDAGVLVGPVDTYTDAALL